MVITWIDKKSTMLNGKKTYRAGDEIPAGLLTAERIETLVKSKKIRVGDIVVDKSVKTVSLFGQPVEAKISGEIIEEPKKPAQRGRPKAGPVVDETEVLPDDDEDEERE